MFQVEEGVAAPFRCPVERGGGRGRSGVSFGSTLWPRLLSHALFFPLLFPVYFSLLLLILVCLLLFFYYSSRDFVTTEYRNVYVNVCTEKEANVVYCTHARIRNVHAAWPVEIRNIDLHPLSKFNV